MIVFQPDRFLLNKFVAENAHLLTGHLLDVGGQDGRRYRKHFDHVEKYTVLDPGEEFEPDIVAGAEAMPLDDASVDSLLCTEVMMDVYELEAAFKEMGRVVKPGGHLLMTVSFMSPLCDEPFHFWRFTPYSLKKLLGNDFTDIKIMSRGHYRIQKAQNWIRYWINRLDLYKRPLLGHLFSVLSKLRFALAQFGDNIDKSDSNRRFTLGYNVIAKRK